MHLNGDDLDVAVARALGWIVKTTTHAFAPGDMVLNRVVPRYSTDAATLPEMLAWLPSDIRITRDEGAVTYAKRTSGGDQEWRRWDAIHYGEATVTSDGVELGHGATLNEAVARLVVAVAGAAKETKETP